MEYHRFNIGEPVVKHDTNAWWAENVARGVITAGYDGLPGDEGERQLQALHEGDWVFAYVNKRGFVGAGRALAVNTYKLHAGLPTGTLSDHCHERGVRWEFVIRDVKEAVAGGSVGIRQFVGTQARLPDSSIAERLLATLRRRGERLVTHHLDMLPVSSADLVALLNSLDAPIVITKNKVGASAGNFRADPSVDGRFLDGRWSGRPAGVEEGRGYVLHHVVHESIIWLGAFGGVQAEVGDTYSYVMDAAVPFLLSDLGQSTVEQRALWAILKHGGPVVTYHEPSGVDGAAATVGFGIAKRRLQQANFRSAVFAHHGARCKVTSCAAGGLLEAAHLVGRSWEAGHNAATDGIPLRVDLHRAYDRGLITLDDQYRLVAVSPELHGQYDSYLDAC
jgi:hypothetical protein